MQIRGDCQELAVGDDPTVSLREALAHLGGSRVVILGVGNVLKGDDAAGPMVCQGVAGWLSVKVIDTGTVPENDLGPILRHAPENVLIVDAKDLGSPVGTIRVLPRTSVVSLGSSTHSLSPRLLADAMAQGISGEVTFLGIQPGRVRLGHPVSVEVDLAVKTVSSVLLEFFLPRAKPYKATKSPSGGGDFVAC